MRAILTYHSIDPSGSPISISEGEFRGHIRWMASRAVQVVPLEWLHKVPAERDAVAVTFDDGFQNFAEVAWPLLKHHDLPATLFVVSERAGTDNDWGPGGRKGIPKLPLAHWDALKRMVDHGLALGSHSRSHPRLTELEGARLAEEIAGSADDIERRSGVRPKAFCYPFGDVNDSAAGLAKQHYEVACTTELAVLPEAPDLHRLPRLDAFYFRSGSMLERWDTPSFRRHVGLRAFGRRVRARFLGG